MNIPENIKAVIISTEGNENHDNIDVSLPGSIVLTVSHEKPTTISVEDVRRQIIETISTRPIGCEQKIYVIPHAELMTPSAQNAILKTLEEPPEYARIVLITTNTQMLLETIRSRCITLRNVSGNEDDNEYEQLIEEIFTTKIDSVRASEMASEIEDVDTFMKGVRKYLVSNHKKINPKRANDALLALDKADSRFTFNVNNELTLEMMLMEI